MKRWRAAALCALAFTAVASAQTVDPRAERSAERDLARIAALRPGQTIEPSWRPFAVAVASNGTVRALLDEADAAGLAPDSPRTQGALLGVVFEVVADGLGRVDDPDLVAAAPLIRKLLSAGRCTDEATLRIVVPERVMIDEQVVGLEPVLTRAVAAVDAARPTIAVDAALLQAARRRIGEGIEGSDRTAVGRFLVDVPAIPGCRLLAVMNRLRFDGTAAELPALLREALRTRPRPERIGAYRPGDPIAYPREALRGGVEGDQRVAFTVGADGRLRDVRFVVSAFSPDVTTRADGSPVESSRLFDDEVRVYLRSAASRYPPRTKDGAPVETTYELPFHWQIDDDAKPRVPSRP